MQYYTLEADSVEVINKAKEKTGVLIQYLQDSVPAMVDFVINIIIAIILNSIRKNFIRIIRLYNPII